MVLVGPAAAFACGGGGSPNFDYGDDDSGASGQMTDATVTGPAGGDAAMASDAASSGDTGTSSADAQSDDDGSMSDAGVTVDASTSSCAGRAYCEDFETYEAGAVANNATLGPWTASLGNTNDAGLVATMTVDGVNAYGGKQALHVYIPPGQAGHGTLHQQATGDAGIVKGNNVFGRAMVFFATTADAGLPYQVHSWVFQSNGNSYQADGGVSMNIGGAGSSATAVPVQINYHFPTTETGMTASAWTTGTWHCLQWEYDGSGTPPANEAKVYFDGVQIIDAPQSKGWQFATPWAAFDFGFTHYQNLMNPVDVFLDDFALDSSFIPCP